MLVESISPKTRGYFIKMGLLCWLVADAGCWHGSMAAIQILPG
jgi:hypothetical protein